MTDWKDYLESIYYEPGHPASYSGPTKLYQWVKSNGKYKIGQNRIREWLQVQDTYSLTRGARRKFRRNRVIVKGVDSQWDSDLMDMQNVSKENDGVRYILVMIDIFSRKLWCQPLKDKTGKSVVKAMTAIFAEGRQPLTMRSDRGREYLNKDVQEYLKQLGVHHFTTNNEPKANYAERVIRTLRQKIFRYTMKKQNYRYVNVLQQLVNSYNRTVHSSLGVTPDSVNKGNEDEVRLNQYLRRKKRTKMKATKRRFRYKVDDTVRISHVRQVFDREITQKWSGEIFKIKSRLFRQDIPVYRLSDWEGEDVGGTFYQSELQGVRVDENTVFKIEKVLKKRTVAGKKQALVRWLHWPKKYDSWLLLSEVKDYE